MVWKDVKLPAGKILIPGIVTHSTNVVEHPELVAWRIKNFASVVGRENVIAGTDCGFAQSYNVRCHPSVQWAKLEWPFEGARLASRELWAKRKAKPAKARKSTPAGRKVGPRFTVPQQADGRVTILSSSRRVSSNRNVLCRAHPSGYCLFQRLGRAFVQSRSIDRSTRLGALREVRSDVAVTVTAHKRR